MSKIFPLDASIMILVSRSMVLSVLCSDLHRLYNVL